MNKEKSHMQGYTFLKNSFLCLLLSKQSKRKVIEKKPHCDTETKKTPTQDQFSGTEQTTRKMQFSMSMFNFPFFFPLFEQILVSAQSSAQPHIQEQGREGSCQ